MPTEGGALFKGSKGTLMCGVYGDSPRLIPEDAMRSFARPKPSLPRIPGGSSGHEMDWVRAAKAGSQPEAHFGYSGPLTETCLLGNIAKRMDKPIEWDAASLKIKNSPEANQYIRTEYRSGWSLGV